MFTVPSFQHIASGATDSKADFRGKTFFHFKQNSRDFGVIMKFFLTWAQVGKYLFIPVSSVVTFILIFLSLSVGLNFII